MFSRYRYCKFSPVSLIIILACIANAFAATDNLTSSPPNAAAFDQAHALSPEQEGDLLMARRSYAGAIDAYQRESHRTAVLLNKIGLAYHHMFGFDLAGKYYKQALAINPTSPKR